MAERSDAAVDASVLSLFTAANATPLVVDLRSFRSMKDSERRKNADYLSRVASVAAKVLGTDKEAIWGSYYRAQHLLSAFLATIMIAFFSLAVALGFGIRAEVTQRNRAERELVNVRAAMIWSELRFGQLISLRGSFDRHESNSLWDLTTTHPAIRAAFLSQLSADLTLIRKFTEKPDSILRGFGLRVSTQDAELLLNSLLKASPKTDQLKLADALRALAPYLQPTQAEVALNTVLRTLPLDPAYIRTELPIGKDNPDVAAAVALVRNLSGGQVWRALNPYLSILSTPGARDVLDVRFGVVRALASKLDSAQARETLAAIVPVKGFRGGPILAQSRFKQAEVLHALILRMNFVEVLSEIKPVTDAILKAFEDAGAEEFKFLAKAAQLLGVPLSLQGQRQVYGRLEALLKGADEQHEVIDLIEASQALAAISNVQGTTKILSRLLRWFQSEIGVVGSGNYKRIGKLKGVVQIINSLPAKPTSEQAQAMTGFVLDRIETVSDSVQGEDLAEVLGVLSTKSTAEQVRRILSVFLATNDARELNDLAKVLGSANLSSDEILLAFEHAEANWDKILFAFPSQRAQVYKDAGSIFASRLTSDQARTALPALIKGLAKQVPARVLAALPIQFTPQDSKTIVNLLTERLKSQSDRYSVEALAYDLQVLGPKLRGEDIIPPIDIIIAERAESKGESRVVGENVVAQTLTVFATKLPKEARTRKLKLAQSELAASSDADQAMLWAAAVEALLSPSSASEYTGGVIEILKYPASALREWHYTSNLLALSPTDYLATRLVHRFPDIPTADLPSVLEWVASKYPKIDIDRPPRRVETLSVAIHDGVD
jgi:hypothetical protein